MPQQLVDSIRSRGYWRINFRPTRPDPDAPVTLDRCFSLVNANSVSLRGWDYPHIPHRQGTDTAVERHDSFVEGWTDWYDHREFWRMYASTQFLHYRALYEDWPERGMHRNPAGVGRPEQPTLGVTSNLWLIAEVFEFLSRLTGSAAMYRAGVDVSIGLISGSTGRLLAIEDQRRMPFAYDRVTHAQRIVWERTLSPSQTAEPRKLAQLTAERLFDRFGWTPAAGQLTSEIDNLYAL